MERAERGSARAAEQVFKICELMPSGPVTVRVEDCQKLSHLLRSKRQTPGAVGYDGGKVNTVSEGLG